jgi:type II secretory pathway component GspD/PulD (secretin)
MLDARVVVLDRADLLDFGVQWDFPTASAGTFTSDQTADPNWPYVVQIGFTPGRAFTNALSLNLNLLSQNDDASIISSPKVLAQDGQEAQISITTEEFFEVTGDADVFTRAELEEIETGTTLLIKPHIGSNNKITLDLNIEVSDVIARGDENLPIVSRRTANSTVQVEDGGTAAIAGLIDTRSQLGIAGVPGLSKAPLIGNAFGNDTVEQRERQVAVFVTATLVKDDDEFFKRGHKAVPPLNTVSEEKYRAQLKRALETLRASTENPAEETKP